METDHNQLIKIDRNELIENVKNTLGAYEGCIEHLKTLENTAVDAYYENTNNNDILFGFEHLHGSLLTSIAYYNELKEVIEFFKNNEVENDTTYKRYVIKSYAAINYLKTIYDLIHNK